MSTPAAANSTFALRQVNGEAAVVVNDGDALDGVLFLTVQDDRITAIHGIRNPEKLHAV